MNPHKCDALIVDLELESRMRLRQATSNLPNFAHIAMANSGAEGMRQLQAEQNCDVIFVRHNPHSEDVTSFIRRCKETKQGKESALILVLKEESRNTSMVAANFASGVDGFLCEPYSVDDLTRIAEIAERVKEKKLADRWKSATSTLLEKSALLIDELALHRSIELVSPNLQRERKKLASALAELSQAKEGAYQALLIEIFEARALPTATPTNSYSGASQRVRRMLQDKKNHDSTEEEVPNSEQASSKAAPGRYIVRKR